jgi:hypothetical protein
MSAETFSLARVAGILYKKWSLPMSLTAGLTLYLRFCASISEQSFSNFFVEKQVCAEKYFKYVEGRAVLSYLVIFIYPWYSGKHRFLNLQSFSIHPNSKSVFAHLGMALRVLFLPLSGFHCTISSSASALLLLLKGEVALYVSLLESSLKLPSSESESFTVLLIVSVPINFFCEEFSQIELSPGFAILLEAR